MMRDSLEEAVKTLTGEIGQDMGSWRYGNVHVAEIEHPFRHLVDEATGVRINVGPLPRGGGSNTLNANHGNDRQRSGASFRMIVDTADWDAAVGTNTPGQSGDPRSPYYNNLFKGWNEADYFPLYYSREKVELATDSKTILNP